MTKNLTITGVRLLQGRAVTKRAPHVTLLSIAVDPKDICTVGHQELLPWAIPIIRAQAQEEGDFTRIKGNRGQAWNGLLESMILNIYKTIR